MSTPQLAALFARALIIDAVTRLGSGSASTQATTPKRLERSRDVKKIVQPTLARARKSNAQFLN